MSMEVEEKIKTIEHYSYFLSDTIGKGFSSTVYKGKNKDSGLPVAIKVIDLRKLSESTMKQLLQSEIGIIKSLNHANILKCENVYITVNNCYIITQLCQGGDLAQEIKKKGRLRGVQALKIMLEIARAIDHLASLNIIHRDIKPANILLHESNVKIADFGFARYEEQGKKQKYNVGTPLYMSPEAIFSNFYSKQNDVWSLGVVFYEILQGRPPWDPKNEKELKDILKEKKEVFFRIAVRDELQSIIRGCLKHERTERMSLGSVIGVLEQIMKEMQSEDNVAYRETLTKRNLNTLSCKDLNQTPPLIPATNPEIRMLINKIPKPPTETAVHKQNTKKQEKPVVEPMTAILRNRSAIELKQKKENTPSEPVEHSLEDASRHNHWILKSVINYSRLIYKSYSRLDKLEIRQSLRSEIQGCMVDLLQFSINWLKESVSAPKEAEKFGLLHYDKFRQTRCYSKSVLVINEYYQRYIKFANKTRRSLASKKPGLQVQATNLNDCATKLRKCLQQTCVHPCRAEHNIAIDFLISIEILAKMLQSYGTAYFAQFSHIEDIVQNDPAFMTEQPQLDELAAKLRQVSNS